MGKPVEKQNHSLAFFALAVAIAACTAWAFWDELRGSRPWKEYQEQAFALERDKAAQDLRHLERQLEAGEIKVTLDGQTLTVAEAQRQLGELRRAQGDQEEVRRLLDRWKQARQASDEAQAKLRRLKTEDDALFFRAQRAGSEEALALEAARRSAMGGDPVQAAGARRKGEEAAAARSAIEQERVAKKAQIERAGALSTEAQRAALEAKADYEAKAGKIARLEAALETALDPLHTARATLEAARGKGAQLSQYWLTGLGGAVDRCQSCHVAVDRCGFSRPVEVLSALNAPEAEPAKVASEFCVRTGTVESYRATADAVCSLSWANEPPSDGAGECLVVMDDRRRVAAFLRTYCGKAQSSLALLEDARQGAACLSPSDWAVIAPFVEAPTRKRGADGRSWSACELELSESGEQCVEGEAHDELEGWLKRHCPDGAPVLRGLARYSKACASQQSAKRLASLKPVSFEVPLFAQTHPYRRELLGSNHPPQQFGCTVCHEGQGAQTKGVAGAGFRHGWDDEFWDRPLLDLVALKKHRPASFGPPPPELGVPGEQVGHQRQFVQSSCAKCHTEEISLPFAQTYGRGRRLVTELGCIGCHPTDGLETFPRVGPALDALKTKTNPGFLVSWLAYPSGLRPRTRMPNFWPEALDVGHRLREGSPEATRRAEEVRDIAAYLWKQSKKEELPAPPPGNAERGRVLANEVGCRACHSFSPVEKLCSPEQVKAGKSRGSAEKPGECEVPRALSGSASRDLAPNLSDAGRASKASWLFAYVKNPKQVWAEARMPSLRLSDGQAADLAAYLTTLREGPEPAAEPLFEDEAAPAFDAAADRGRQRVTQYGCAGCHRIPGHEAEAKVGTDFNGYGRKPVDLFDFGNAMPNPRQRSWYGFVDLKLRAPHAFRYERVDTRMPQHDLNDAEVDALMTFLKSRTGDKVPPGYLAARNEQLTAIARGEQVIDQYSCRTCHFIGSEGGALRDTYRVDDLAKLAPPSLQAQGFRAQPDWLFDFLKDPSLSMRPWLRVRMPTFDLSDRQATALVHSFAARDEVAYPYLSAEVEMPEGPARAEAAGLFQQLRCMACHPVGKPAPGADRASLAPNFLLDRKRLRPDWVAAFIKDPQSLQAGTRMPAFFNLEDFEAVMYPKYFGGSQKAQIQALADYVMTLKESDAEKLEAAALKAARQAAEQQQ